MKLSLDTKIPRDILLQTLRDLEVIVNAISETKERCNEESFEFAVFLLGMQYQRERF